MKHTFSAEEMQLILDAQSEFSRSLDSIKGVLSNGLLENLQNGTRKLELALVNFRLAQSEYEAEESDAFREIARRRGLTSRWANDIASRQMNDPAPFPCVKMVCHFGHVATPTMVKPTWLDLWVIADDLIRQSGNARHVFIEGFNYIEESKILELVTGT